MVELAFWLSGASGRGLSAVHGLEGVGVVISL